jgi:hypothetical protein
MCALDVVGARRVVTADANFGIAVWGATDAMEKAGYVPAVYLHVRNVLGAGKNLAGETCSIAIAVPVMPEGGVVVDGVGVPPLDRNDG